MRVMGVNGSSETLWLACADDTGLVDMTTFRVDKASALETGDALIAARDSLRRVMRTNDVTRVVLLSAGNDGQHKVGYHAAVPRITMETVVAFAAAEEGIEFARISRATALSWLDLPAKGGVDAHISTLVPVPKAPHWKKKRDLASMAALAGARDLGAQADGEN
ncbi:hypothetical protein SAMN04489844_1480 [Nocardioides exalbidus]|uniref:Uncharacterized protein n=1 Tax=Nocardioides exalbidus TaxID=402596 RepID=A0A1H4NY06_9ACTN|nr:hypothetical protein [Nocardioides exalbidus]SEC00034.1 hypothetical protein SAMN04489844_1480 [Nocardioides exalbidus]